jgi:hypothetical protein
MAAYGVRKGGRVRNWFGGSGTVFAAAGVFLAVLVLTAPAAGQVPAASAYTSPRTPDGQPDLQGFWQVLNTASWDLQAHGAMWGVPAGLGVVEGNEIPYLPAALAKKKQNFENRMSADPTEVHCGIAGVPRITYMPFPFQIVQSADHVAILYEYDHHNRIVYLNSAKHNEGLTAYLGDSRGRWEGNSLVVDVTNFTDETWFDRAGNFHSDALHVVERYTRTSSDIITYEATIEDPKVFSRSWKISMPLYRRQDANFRLLEYECHALGNKLDGRFTKGRTR